MKAIRKIEEDIILLVSDNSIEDGLLHDTYARYGQQVDSYEAGDWCFSQPDFLKAAKAEAVEKLGEIDWNNFNIDVIGDKEVDVYSEDDENKDDVDLAKRIKSFMNSWAEDNYTAMEATYLTYWDGHNHQSIVFSSSADKSEYYEILDDEESEEYIDMYNRADWSEWAYGHRFAHIDGYVIRQSQFESNFEIASIEKEDNL